MKRVLICLLVSLLSLAAVAQDLSAEIEQLTKEMYRLYPHRENPTEFLDVTNRLKQAAQKADDERTFYKAWGNQATFSFAAVSRERGLAIANEMKEYAQQHNDHFGLYASTSINASMLSTLHIYDQATKAFEDAIKYLHDYYPDESAASAYLGLAKIYINQKKPEKVRECATKALAEPGIIAQHQLSAWSYMCMSYATTFKDKELRRDDFNRCYEEREKIKAEFECDDNFSELVDFEHAMMNNRYQDAQKVAESIKSPMDRSHRLGMVYKELGDYKQALEYYENYYQLRDSVNTEEIRKQASEYAVQLGVAKAEIEAQRSAERTHHVFMFMLGIVAAIVIAALAFILHRRNRHAKEIDAAYGKLEEAYEELEKTSTAKERIESELRIARDIQMSMVPRDFSGFPPKSGIDLYASMSPAKEVGGDLYDFFLQGDKLYICVGDVSGKGVPASMTMAVAVNLFRNVAKEGFPPEYIATRLNDTLAADNESGMFVTMFIAEINLSTGQMNFCNAGHTPPLIVDRPIEQHEPCRPKYLEMESNAPIGLWPDIEFAGQNIQNIKGRTLFLYTDGVTEAENSSRIQFGEERLFEFFKKRPYDNSRQTINLMQAAIVAFAGDAEPSDDITMMCLKIN